MITVNKLDTRYEHFNPDGKSLGFLNFEEHTDLTIQLIEHYEEGYYFISKNGYRYDIDRFGTFDNFEYNNHPYKWVDSLLRKKIKLQMEKRKKEYEEKT